MDSMGRKVKEQQRERATGMICILLVILPERGEGEYSCCMGEAIKITQVRHEIRESREG